MLSNIHQVPKAGCGFWPIFKFAPVPPIPHKPNSYRGFERWVSLSYVQDLASPIRSCLAISARLKVKYLLPERFRISAVTCSALTISRKRR